MNLMMFFKCKLFTQPKTLCLLAASLTLASVSMAEGNGRGGGDNPTIGAHDAWFLGTESIPYCYELSGTFGATSSQIETEIEAAFQTWGDYIEEKHVNARPSDHSDRPLINAHHRKLAKCDGSEKLTFYFGTDSAEIQAEKAKYMNPVAFVVKKSFDLMTGIGSGYIWIANQGGVLSDGTGITYPDWNKTNELRAVILHELGHVFGNGHVPGTIMAEDFSSRLQYDQGVWAKRIDDKAELYSCEECSVTGVVSLDTEKAKVAFKRFTGKEPVGTPHATITLQPTLTLSLTDTAGTYTIALTLAKTPSGEIDVSQISLDAEPVFSASMKNAKGEWIGRARHLDAGVAYATAKDHDGKSLTLTIDFNLTSNEVSFPIQVKYFDQGTRRDLLLARPSRHK